MKTDMKIGEYCTYKKRVVKCVECTDADPCAGCCLFYDMACMAVNCMATTRADRKTVHFKMLGYRRRRYADEA